MSITNTIRSEFNQMAVDHIRPSKSPRKTLLGRTGFKFQSVIDVGANKRQFAKEISAFFPKAQSYCFDPFNASYPKLANFDRREPYFNTLKREAPADITRDILLKLDVQGTKDCMLSGRFFL